MVCPKKSVEKVPLVTDRPEEGVGAGGGDSPPHPPAPTVPPAMKTNNNSVDMNYIDEQLTIISKRNRINRWPEFLTALWMSFAAFAITFISFYIYVYLRLGHMGTSSKESLYFGLPGYNASRIGSEVFFHHIVPRGGALPFPIYSDFLSVTSRQFPNLKFTVYFLLDDTLESYKRGPRITASMSFAKWVQHMDLPLKFRIKKFIKYHPNMNIIIMTLSNYMMRTPIKSKYRMMPRDFLEFYIRVFSVYLHGGAGLDLAAFNHLYATHQRINSQIAVILQTHNNGYTLEEYEDMMQQMQDNVDDKTIASLFMMLSSMMDEAKSFFDRSFLPELLFDGPMSNNAQPPKQRSKREPIIFRTAPFSVLSIVPAKTINSTNNNNATDKSASTTTDINIIETNITITIVNDSYIDNVDKKDEKTNANDAKNSKEINVLKITETKEEKNGKSINTQQSTSEPCTTTTCRLQAAGLMPSEFHDFAMWANQLGPYLLSPFGEMSSQDQFFNSPTTTGNRRHPPAVYKNFISLDRYGEFIVATGRYHPLLEEILLAGNYNLGPKFAIESVILEQCSGSMQYGDVNGDFCETIHII